MRSVKLEIEIPEDIFNKILSWQQIKQATGNWYPEGDMGDWLIQETMAKMQKRIDTITKTQKAMQELADLAEQIKSNKEATT